MKKSLLAVAALGAFASAAQAQSSVTVYGILDVGYMSQSVRAAGTPGAQGVAGANNATLTNTGSFASSAEQSSRLGFRGTEDLGGGANAFFTVEFGLNPNNSQSVGTGGPVAAPAAGAGLAAANAGGTGLNNRQSFVGLGKKGLGSASIGTQYTPIHEAVAQTDAGQANNMPGNLIYASDLSAGGSSDSGFVATPTAQAGNFNAAAQVIGGPGSGNVPYTVRAGNSLKLQSDNFAGFVGKLFYTQANTTTNSVTPANNAAQTGGVNNTSGYGIGVDYTFKKLLVTADYQAFKQSQSAQGALNANGVQTVTAGVPSGTTWGVGGTMANIQEAQTYVAGTYDFGILKAYAQYLNRKVTSTFDSSVYMQRSAQQIGVRSFVTPTIEPWASVSTGKLTNQYYVLTAAGGVTTGATANVGANLSAWQLGSNYWLSKRTNLYAIYGISRTGNAVYPTTVTGNVANINTNSSYVSAYALGMRHTF